MEDLTGRQLGPYQIKGPLGEGGMAAIYRAFHAGTDRDVALKVLPRQLGEEPQFAARFEREARLVAQLQHPHIVPVFDFGQAQGFSYIVMPLVKGGTLVDEMQGQPVALARIRQIITQVGGALEYAHQRGMIHRDVKPRNILIDETGNCLLSDFGLARMTEPAAALTTSGTIMGTPAYMSPEQGAGEPLDNRTDIYSLGIILYELATGRVPFRAETPIAVILKHIQDPLPSARALNPELPAALEAVLARALAKRPDNRFQTAADFVHAVQAALPEPATPPAGARPLAGFALGRRAGPSASQAVTVPDQTRAAGWPASRGLLLALLAVLIAGLGLSAWLTGWNPLAIAAATPTPTASSTLTRPPTLTRTATASRTARPTQTATLEFTPTPAPTATPPQTPAPRPVVNFPCEESLIKFKVWEGDLQLDCDYADKKAGQVSLRLTAVGFSNVEVYSALVPVQPNREYVVSYWIKTNLEVRDAQLFGRVTVSQYGAGAQEADDILVGRLDSGFNLGENVGGATDWSLRSFVFATGLETQFVRLRGFLAGFGLARGSLWLDQVTFRER